MIDFIPYFGVLITLLFSVGFAYAVGGGFDKDRKDK
jgi:predicted PurR-regulated permease PerM